MSTISKIIHTLSEADRKEFVAFLNKKNRRGDTKNVQLFQLIAKDFKGQIDEELYGKPSKNAYHALSKRLQDALIDFIATKGFSEETSEEMDILKFLLAARIFFEYKEYKIAFKTLQKAEKLALSLDVYTLLAEINHTKIQYAHYNEYWDLNELIASTQHNLHLVQREQHLNMAYASIKAQLKSNTTKPVNEIILEAFSKFNIEVDTTLTFKSLYQLLNITATAATLQSDYHQISPYMLTLYKIVSEKQKETLTKDKHLYYHIEILNLMAITNFRNKNFRASSEFTTLMKTQMLKQNSTYYNRFLEKWTVLKALNQNYTGASSNAISLLQKYKGDSLDIKLTLVMCHFQQNNYKEAYAILKHFQHSDRWYEKKTGWIWVLKKNIIEILLLMELDKLDLVLTRLESFNKRFGKRLKKVGENRVIQFMKLVRLYYENPMAVTSEKFKNKVENSFEWIGKEQEDIFVMSFYAWLKSKMEQTSLYETTLKLAQ
ncbi:hypothetical protein [Cochleicola gelatinilyticus]|uniref:Uncharacterized protein n=1 Tax=Cochleicola gelatinilyticus TaxID=1763537 RepID=A0A167II76_9FLAO|nr:hypothetical protein [Cochleicola gelatinilyticus]OAB79677.1 hypothetical protein ULVI_02715 [Cochleicola gelatinilyticus]